MARTLVAASSHRLTRTAAPITAFPFTLASWIRPVSITDGGFHVALSLVKAGSVGGASFASLYQHNGDVQAWMTGSGSGGASIVTGLTAGVWGHAAAVYTSVASRTAYVNGTAGTPETSSQATLTFDTIQIGADYYVGGPVANDFFDGDLAEAGIWSVALDAAEIAALAKGFDPRLIRPQSLVAYWPIHGNNSPELDRWKNGYDLTLTGTPAKADSPRLYLRSRSKIGYGTSAASFAADVAASVTLVAALSAGAVFGAAATASATTTAALSVNAAMRAAATGTATTSATLGTGVSLRAAATASVTTSATFAELVPLGQASVQLAGVEARARISGATIRDLLNASPNTCSFTVEGTAPTAGQSVAITIGDGTIAPLLLFAGAIQTVEQIYEGGDPNHLAWRVTATDYIVQLNRRKVRKRYAQQSATAIALDVIANFTSNFTTGGIVAGLPTVTGGIDFTEEDVLACLTRIGTRIGGYANVDYAKDVKLFLTDVSGAPDDLVPGSRTLQDDPPVTVDADITQIRTRVRVEGGGSQARSAVAVGATTLPVTDASWYPGTGGIVVSGPQRITYTGKGDVGGPAAPSGVASLIAGLLAGGPYTYKVTQIDAGVETPLSVASSPISIAAVPPPSSTPTAANGAFSAPAGGPTPGARTSGGAVDDGNHIWGHTYVTATGETTLGVTSSQITVAHLAAPSAPTVSAPTAGAGVGVPLTAGMGPQYQRWSVTLLNAAGETAPSALTADGTWAPFGDTPPTAPTLGSTSAGNIPAGQHSWVLTFVTAAGETLPSNPATAIPVSALQQAMTLQLGPAGTTARKLYRSRVGHSELELVATIADNTTTAYTDNTSDASIAGAAQAPTIDGSVRAQFPLTLPLGPAGTTGRRVYRNTGGATPQLLVATINDNTTTTFSDTVPNSALGAAAPSSNTASMSTVPITGISVGPSGTTARKLYRSKIGAPTGTLFLVATISGNTTTTFSDTVADSALGAAAPTVNTAGGALGAGVYKWLITYGTATGESVGSSLQTFTASTGSVALAAIPVSADARVTKRNVYRTVVGGSVLLFEGTINDNTTTTFNSAGADGALGAAYSGVDSTAFGKIAVSGIATGGVTVTARKLYRTPAGGAIYKLVATINDNTTTTFLDNVADASLGVVASGETVTQLTGIPASGPGSILYPILISDPVNIMVVCDDVPAQVALAASEGGGSDGIVEHYIQDGRLAIAEATATGNADLTLFSRPILTVKYTTRDPKTRSGKTVHVDLPSLNLLGDFTIQSVTIDQIDIAEGVYPRYTVEASSVHFSFEDVLRKFQVAA